MGYNPVTRMIQLYADQLNPNTQTIRVTTTDRGIDIDNASFITIRNLHVTQNRFLICTRLMCRI